MEELCSFGTTLRAFYTLRTYVDGPLKNNRVQVAVSHKRTWAVEAEMSGIMSTSPDGIRGFERATSRV